MPYFLKYSAINGCQGASLNKQGIQLSTRLIQTTNSYKQVDINSLAVLCP